MNSSLTNMKISTINDHNPDEITDKLYEPFRNIIINPEAVIDHEIESPRGADKSIIHDNYKRLTMVEVAYNVNIYLILEKRFLHSH